MSEAEVRHILEKINDKELADLLGSYISHPNELQLLLLLTKLGVTMESGKINALIYSVSYWNEIDENDQKETHIQLGGIITDGILYMLELVYNRTIKYTKIQLKERSGMILGVYEMNEGDHNEG